MECPDKARLVNEYSATLLEFSRSLRALRNMLGEIAEEDWQYAEQIRLRAEQARATLEQHLKEHGC